MELFKLAVASIAVLTLLLSIVNADPVDTNSSKPYCNITRYFPRTSIEEVTAVITDAVVELDNICNENEVVSAQNIYYIITYSVLARNIICIIFFLGMCS